jgi:hypothetical protein
MTKAINVCGNASGVCEITLEVSGGFSTKTLVVERGDFALKFQAPTIDPNAEIVIFQKCNDVKVYEVQRKLGAFLGSKCVQLLPK